MIDGDISAAVPLISMGALLGRTTPIQLLFMGLVEIAIFALNEYVQLDMLRVGEVDVVLEEVEAAVDFPN